MSRRIAGCRLGGAVGDALDVAESILRAYHGHFLAVAIDNHDHAGIVLAIIDGFVEHLRAAGAPETTVETLSGELFGTARELFVRAWIDGAYEEAAWEGTDDVDETREREEATDVFDAAIASARRRGPASEGT